MGLKIYLILQLGARGLNCDTQKKCHAGMRSTSHFHSTSDVSGSNEKWNENEYVDSRKRTCVEQHEENRKKWNNIIV